MVIGGCLFCEWGRVSWGRIRGFVGFFGVWFGEGFSSAGFEVGAGGSNK